MPRPVVAALVLPLALCLFALAGCSATPGGTSAAAGDGREGDFRPVKLRLHPTFTQIQDWSGDKVPDGIDVVIEMLDGYDDPAKGRGSMLFELWTYHRFSSNILGPRAVDPWRGPLLTRQEQVAHWNRTLRAYTFQLAFPGVDRTKEYVLTASFQPADATDAPAGPRLYDRLVLEPKAAGKTAGR
jgi:hypothetical protein